MEIVVSLDIQTNEEKSRKLIRDVSTSMDTKAEGNNTEHSETNRLEEKPLETVKTPLRVESTGQSKLF